MGEFSTETYYFRIQSVQVFYSRNFKEYLKFIYFKISLNTITSPEKKYFCFNEKKNCYYPSTGDFSILHFLSSLSVFKRKSGASKVTVLVVYFLNHSFYGTYIFAKCSKK